MKQNEATRAQKKMSGRRTTVQSHLKKSTSRLVELTDERLRQLAHAFEQSPVSVFITDLQGTIEYVNPKFTQVTGYTFDEGIGQNPRILKSGETSAGSYKQMWQTIASGDEWHGEFHNRKKNGELYWESAVISSITNEQGEITHYLAVKEDITERKRIEVALKASEQYARSIVDSSLDMIVAVDNQRRITEFNPAAQQVFGYSRDEVIGKHINILYADSREGQSVHQTVFLQGKLIQEIWNKRKNGEVFPAYLSASVMRNDQGELLGVVGVSRDITASKQAEESLKRRDAVLAALTFAAEQFLRSTSWEKSIVQVLERLGKATRVSRVYVFENSHNDQGTLFWKQRFEWTSPGISSQIDNPELQNLPVDESGYARWREVLGKGHLIQGNVKDMPLDEQPLLNEQDIQSLVVVPIFARKIWWGFLGFDECAMEREWSVAEIDVLSAAADTLGAAIERD